MRGHLDLQQYLKEHEVEAEIVHLGTEVRTVAQAAQAVEVSESQIVKSLLFMVEAEPVLVIALGPNRVPIIAIAELLKVDSASVELGTPEQVVKYTGYPVGTVPPVGITSNLPTLVDRKLMEQAIVYAGGGAKDVLLKLKPNVLLLHSKGRLVELLDPAEDNFGHKA